MLIPISQKAILEITVTFAATRELFKAGVHMNLSEILGSLKKAVERGKKVMEHHQTVARPYNGTPVGGQLFGVHLTIFDFKF